MGVSFHFWVHCSIKHQAFLQVKSIFSPGCLGQVMTVQRSGAATQQAFCSNTKLMLHLKPLGLALHFSTMSLWSSLLVYDVKIPPTSYLWGNRTNYFLVPRSQRRKMMKLCLRQSRQCCTTSVNFLPPRLRAAVILPTTRLLREIKWENDIK